MGRHKRAFPENTSNINARDSYLDLNNVFDRVGLRKQIAATVFSRTTMPLALVTYNKFWQDMKAVSNFINYLGDPNTSGGDMFIPTVMDGAGNLVANMPGKPIANPGAYIDQVVGRPLKLDGSQSLSADTYSWSVSPINNVTLINANTDTPAFTASTPGVYTITLIVSNNETIDSNGITRPVDTSIPASVSIKVVDSPFSRITFDSAIKNSPNNARCLKCHSSEYVTDVAGFDAFDSFHGYFKMSELERYSIVNSNFMSRLLYKPAGLVSDVPAGFPTLGNDDRIHKGGKIIREESNYYSLLKNWIEDGSCKSETDCQRINVTNENTELEIDPLSPFIDKSLFVILTEKPSANGTLSLIANNQLLYIPKLGFTGMDSYQYLLMDMQTGSTRLVIDKVYVFPDLGLIPVDLNKTFSSQFSVVIPEIGSAYKFEKVNTDGDTLPNYVDDFPNNPLISRDNDGDGLPDDFNTNISDEQAVTSGIVIDTDDDNDGVLDVNDKFPLDSLMNLFVDSDRDGVADVVDPYPLDMLGTIFEDFETGNFSKMPWITSGNGTWHIVPPLDIEGSTTPLSLTDSFTAKTPTLINNESASLAINLTVSDGYLSFWYFLSSEVDFDELVFEIDDVPQIMEQTSDWTRFSIPVTTGNHTFTWIYSKDGSVSTGLDAAWIDSIVFSGPQDSDADGASDTLDNCPSIKNTSQGNVDADGFGDACDTGDFDNDGLIDTAEIALGTDPADSDSDQDGVVDGVDAYPTDPAASIDSDGDGHPDHLAPGVFSTTIPPLTADLAPFNSRSGLDIDGDGVGDNAIYTIAGTGVPGFNGNDIQATTAQLNSPRGLVIDAAGNLIIADTSNHRIRRIDGATGDITTIAGTGTAGFSGDDIQATAAQLNFPEGLVIDTAGNLIIADSRNRRIRRIDGTTGIITTIAGTEGVGFSGDGGLATAAQLSSPSGLVIDAEDNLIIADTSNHRIRRIDSTTGIITTIAGIGDFGFSGDSGLATAAQLASPRRLVIDAAGNLIIADSLNHRIRRIDRITGVITTIAGTGVLGFSGDGGLATTAHLASPGDLVFDAAGNLIIADTFNNRIRHVSLINNPDAFPYDPAASIDTDSDGFPDSFNPNATTEQIAASGLTVDAFPADPTASIDTDSDGWPDQFFISSGAVSALTLTEDFDDDGDGLNDVDELIIGTNHIIADTDGDGTIDGTDDFPLDSSEQKDTDGDSIGDNTDIFPNDASETLDFDNDGIGDNADTDADDDGLPDTYELVRGLNPLSAIDSGFDLDGDGYNNIIEYVFGFELNNSSSHPSFSLVEIDSDGDGLPDANDAFPMNASEFIDSDGDGIGNNADTDDDDDETIDSLDEMPLDASDTKDTDGDGIGNNIDAFPNDVAESIDTDGDGVGNNADSDDDGDTIADSLDNCPLIANSPQTDSDGDGVGDACTNNNNASNNSKGGGSIFVSSIGLLALLLLALIRSMVRNKSINIARDDCQ